MPSRPAAIGVANEVPDFLSIRSEIHADFMPAAMMLKFSFPVCAGGVVKSLFPNASVALIQNTVAMRAG
ncbi:hypothetical protein HYFRA_00014033 [Hymenoscyphus fraxineus]|uniref:Uncharacterized protein n=1 Tax=Hymenoscyphus fraxineus TaxID=746836 RepID=A0A9N9Q0C0_9HELO|nr:hypothetical protein HYFRA_00014033 [Hymenoscyphus fraxineus]